MGSVSLACIPPDSDCYPPFCCTSPASSLLSGSSRRSRPRTNVVGVLAETRGSQRRCQFLTSLRPTFWKSVTLCTDALSPVPLSSAFAFMHLKDGTFELPAARSSLLSPGRYRRLLRWVRRGSGRFTRRSSRLGAQSRADKTKRGLSLAASRPCVAASQQSVGAFAEQARAKP